MSQKGRYTGMIFIGISIVLSSVAQLSMKAGMLVLSNEGITLSIPQTVEELSLLVPAFTWVAGGLLCYSVSVLCWMRALAQHDLSLAYPMLSLSYVLVYFGAVAWPLLHETLSLTRIAGIVLICVGVLIVARTAYGHAE